MPEEKRDCLVTFKLPNMLINYYKDNKIQELNALVAEQIERGSLNIQALIELAVLDEDAASLAKKIINTHQIEDHHLVDEISKKIIADIEKYVDENLEKFPKYTLNAWQMIQSDIDNSTSKFFNLIALLKDVSSLGRKLLESAPQFESIKSPVTPEITTCEIEAKSLFSQMPKSGKKLTDEDATSDDLLAALIESSSSDDFLVLSSSLESITNRDMILASLILIKSHECFTLSHDIQGVVMVLRRTKFLILNILAPKNQMDLVTKLLTSISRYNEMNYVFDLFRDRNQFEILLSKGVQKTPDLRIALFNYVKKNPEFYALVTLNFSMFREIAESLEASATKRLDAAIKNTTHKDIKSNKRASICCGSSKDQFNISFAAAATSRQASSPIPTSSCSDTIPNRHTETLSSTNDDNKCQILHSEESLNLSLVELVDASDCFAKAGCYKRSNSCENRAKLIALQLALLSSGTNVLSLQQPELCDLIASFESFSDAYIVAEAYDYHLAWRQALFKNVILCGDRAASRAYLNEFCCKCDLSTALIMELVILFKQKYSANNQSLNHEDNARMVTSMKLILSKLTNIELKCKLFTQLDFTDSKEALLENPANRAHLRDLKLA